MNTALQSVHSAHCSWQKIKLCFVYSTPVARTGVTRIMNQVLLVSPQDFERKNFKTLKQKDSKPCPTAFAWSLRPCVLLLCQYCANQTVMLPGQPQQVWQVCVWETTYGILGAERNAFGAPSRKLCPSHACLANTFRANVCGCPGSCHGTGASVKKRGLWSKPTTVRMVNKCNKKCRIGHTKCSMLNGR